MNADINDLHNSSEYPLRNGARVTVVYPFSVVWRVHRVVDDAVKSGRMSATEAAIIHDFTHHTELPEGFRREAADGGFAPQQVF